MDRTIPTQVAYAGSLSAAILLLYGVPQASVLGPLLFLLYTAELFDITAGTGLTSHSYADDTAVHQHPGSICHDDCATVCVLCREGKCLDEQQPAQDERRQEATALAWDTTTAGQADCHRTIAAVCTRAALDDGV